MQGSGAVGCQLVRVLMSILAYEAEENYLVVLGFGVYAGQEEMGSGPLMGRRAARSGARGPLSEHKHHFWLCCWKCLALGLLLHPGAQFSPSKKKEDTFVRHTGRMRQFDVGHSPHSDIWALAPSTL